MGLVARPSPFESVSPQTAAARPFDNANPLRAAYMRATRRNGFPHFVFTAGGRQILYCYIRKNACSSFKKLMVGGCSREGFANQFELLKARHGVAFSEGLPRVDHAIFVYRDPFERMASLYVNKFVQISKAADIQRAYREVTGQRPEEASFADFVTSYLSDPRARDPHIRPQRRHLLPIRYTEAIPLRRLHEAMTAILGAELAERHFARPANATRSLPRYEGEDLAERPAAELARRYEEGEGLPATGALLTSPLKRRLATIYREDLIFREP